MDVVASGNIEVLLDVGFGGCACHQAVLYICYTILLKLLRETPSYLQITHTQTNLNNLIKSNNFIF